MPTLCKPSVRVPEYVITTEDALKFAKRLHGGKPHLPESLRYMSVTTVAQRRTLTDDDTRCHNPRPPAPREKPHVMGGFRRWWQVLGSNQRRLSRRFYRPFLYAHRNGR
jgi:hypothetical protein